MEESYDFLIETLEKSIEKNGELPLTNKYLLNILKLTERRIEREEQKSDFSFDPNWD